MIRDGLLTYASTPPFLTRELRAPLPNLLAIAFVTTLLSYHLTSLLLSLLLSLKPARTASLSSVHTLLLVRNSSPLSVLASVLRHDSLTRLHHGRQALRRVTVARHHHQVPLRAALRLLLLLAVAPLVSIASVAVTLSRDAALSASAARFAGVALGFAHPAAPPVRATRISHRCALVPLQLGPRDSALVEFAACQLPIAFQPGFAPGEAGLGFAITRNSSITVWVNVDKVFASRRKSVSMYAGETLYYIEPHVDEEALNRVVEYGMERIASVCGGGREGERDQRVQYPEEDGQEHVVGVLRPCEVETDERAMELAAGILNDVGRFITFVETERLMVAEYRLTFEEGGVPALPFWDGGRIALVMRRSRYVALEALAVVTAVVLLMRVLVALVGNNDVATGVDRLVRERLGFRCCDFLLGEKEMVEFACKSQTGGVAHLGLPMADMPRVESFAGGVIGVERIGNLDSSLVGASTGENSLDDDTMPLAD